MPLYPCVRCVHRLEKKAGVLLCHFHMTQGFPTECGQGWPPGSTRHPPVSVSQSCGVTGTWDHTQVSLCLLGSQTQVLRAPQALFLLTEPFLQFPHWRISELYFEM